MAFHLTSCPINILDLVVTYLGSEEIANLVACGDRTLHESLGKCQVTNLTIKWSPVRWIAWPSTLLALFPNLKRFCIDPSHPQQVCPKMDVKALPGELASLSIQSADVFLYLKHHSINLSTSFPSLTSLRLEGEQFTPTLFRQLPKKLNTLILSSPGVTLRNSDFFPCLPQQLTKLILRMPVVDLDPESLLPSSLEELLIRVRTNFNWFAKFPPNLTFLDVDCNILDESHKQYKSDLGLSWDALPWKLETLLMSAATPMPVLYLEALPGSLTRLKMEIENGWRNNHLEKLPHNLTELDWHTPQRADRFPSLNSPPIPPNLCLLGLVEEYVEHYMVPRSPMFRNMRISLAPYDLRSIPPALTKLSLQQFDYHICTLLPTTLEWLKVEIGEIKVDTAKKLPKSLTVLDLAMNMMKEDEVLLHLGHVREMTWRIGLHTEPVKLTPNCLDHLRREPEEDWKSAPALERFSITYSSAVPGLENIFFDEIFGANFIRLRNLHTFEASGLSDPRFKIGMFHFPDSLTDLRLGEFSYVPTLRDLNALPRNLRKLELEWEPFMDCDWKDSTFKAFPRTLQELSLTIDPQKRTKGNSNKHYPPYLLVGTGQYDVTLSTPPYAALYLSKK